MNDDIDKLITDVIKESMAFDMDKWRKATEEYFKDPWKYADEHRRNISDMEWAGMQQMGDPIYSLGDIVEFKVGGFGRVTTVKEAANGWPCSYATRDAPDRPPHASNKSAWHYEGDILRLIKGASKEISDLIAQLNGDHTKSLIAHVERADRKNSD